MGFGKFSLFLALGILLLWQVGNLRAAPFRSASENSPDVDTLDEEETRLLLAALVKDFVQKKAGETKQEIEGTSLDSLRTKRCSSLSTCMLGAYSHGLNKFHTFSGINFRPGLPSKKKGRKGRRF